MNIIKTQNVQSGIELLIVIHFSPHSFRLSHPPTYSPATLHGFWLGSSPVPYRTVHTVGIYNTRKIHISAPQKVYSYI